MTIIIFNAQVADEDPHTNRCPYKRRFRHSRKWEWRGGSVGRWSLDQPHLPKKKQRNGNGKKKTHAESRRITQNRAESRRITQNRKESRRIAQYRAELQENKKKPAILNRDGKREEKNDFLGHSGHYIEHPSHLYAQMKGGGHRRDRSDPLTHGLVVRQLIKVNGLRALSSLGGFFFIDFF